MEDKILNRVRKMLALAGDAAATEHERDTALKMAYKVLAAHNLSMVDVDQQVPQERRDEVSVVLVHTVWARQIAQQIAKLFFCKYLVGGKTNAWKGWHYFVGKESNATTASLMSEYVITSVLKEARKLYRDDSCPEARSFCVGVCDQLRRRVNALIAEQTSTATAEPGTALVLANLYNSEKEANEKWAVAQYGELKKSAYRGKSEVNSAAYGVGKSFGAKVNLSSQIAGGSSKTLKLK